MATKNSTRSTNTIRAPKGAPPAPEPTSTINDDLRDVIAPAFAVRGMLQGALALLDDHGASDPDGDIWAAREIIEVAWEKVEEIYAKAGELNIQDRIAALEGGAA